MASHNFAQVPKAEIPRSSFDRSSGLKTTIDGGFLYPVFLDEALPGDTFNVKMHAVARMATPIFPIMDNIYLDTFFFAVPYRLLWSKWERFNGAQINPGDSVDFTIPILTPNQEVLSGSLGDYFGLPLNQLNNVSCLPFRAYNLIWNEWFRDQNLQNVAFTSTGDSGDTLNNYPLRRRGKRHDYFSSALPWPQKGESVDIPLGTYAPVVSDQVEPGGLGRPSFNGGGLTNAHIGMQTGTKAASWNIAGGATPSATGIASWGQETGLVADLSNATAATINSLRQAFQIQKILERDARGGTRYQELIKAHFGVTGADARLQRPEYLGGFSQPVNISEIHQTQATETAGTPLGQVGAIGTATMDGNRNGFTSSFTEHCIIIGLINVRADLTYQNQLHRMWSRRTRFDFFWPALAMIGEQAVLNKEMWYGGEATDENVWGYQERYAEYRYKPSMVTGLFRSDTPTPLDSWHLALDYTQRPLLNGTFIEDNPPLDRVVAVPSEPKFILDAWFQTRCARPMPMFGIPGLIDHF